MPNRLSDSSYHAFMLRFWMERDDDARENFAWRFSLENPRTGDLIGFADLDRLIAFISSEMIGTTKRTKRDIEK
jgi:hypothetical protein